MSEEYQFSVNFSEGEIFRKIRNYMCHPHKKIGIEFAEKRMWARLSHAKQNDLRQILKNKLLTKALDALRPIAGLWGDFRIEHKSLAMKCTEVTIRRLRKDVSDGR